MLVKLLYEVCGRACSYQRQKRREYSRRGRINVKVSIITSRTNDLRFELRAFPPNSKAGEHSHNNDKIYFSENSGSALLVNKVDI